MLLWVSVVCRAGALREEVVDNYSEVPQLSCGGYYSLDQLVRVRRSLFENHIRREQTDADIAMIEQRSRAVRRGFFELRCEVRIVDELEPSQ